MVRINRGGVSETEVKKIEASFERKMKQALHLTVASKKELVNAKLRLDNEGFNDEIQILEKYITILGGELKMERERIAGYSRDVEIAPLVSDPGSKR